MMNGKELCVVNAVLCWWFTLLCDGEGGFEGGSEPVANYRNGAITAQMQSIMIGVNIYFTSAGMHSYSHANTFACYQDYL